MKRTLISIGLIMIVTVFSNVNAKIFEERQYLSSEVELMTRSCNRGYFDDCGFLGKMLLSNKEMKKAIESLTTACNGGFMEGCMVLGAIYGFGAGVQQDISKAGGLMRKACNGGMKYACETLEKNPYIFI